jgi:hypothetical protein
MPPSAKRRQRQALPIRRSVKRTGREKMRLRRDDFAHPRPKFRKLRFQTIANSLRRAAVLQPAAQRIKEDKQTVKMPKGEMSSRQRTVYHRPMRPRFWSPYRGA